MTSPLLALGASALRELAAAIASGRVAPPFGEMSVAAWAAPAERPALAAALRDLVAAGLRGPQLALTLELLADQRAALGARQPAVELVWTGPETPGSAGRDTATVARQLFRRAERSVLVATYALYEGRVLFATLARRMEERPALAVRLFLNIPRPHRDRRTSDAELVQAFAERFRRKQWPGKRLPAVFYDPRALDSGPAKAALHAKCIVIDDEEAFVSSANLTEAAHERNIETGILIRQPSLAQALRRQFEALVASKQLVSVPGLG